MYYVAFKTGHGSRQESEKMGLQNGVYLLFFFFFFQWHLNVVFIVTILCWNGEAARTSSSYG